MSIRNENEAKDSRTVLKLDESDFPALGSTVAHMTIPPRTKSAPPSIDDPMVETSKPPFQGMGDHVSSESKQKVSVFDKGVYSGRRFEDRRRNFDHGKKPPGYYPFKYYPEYPPHLEPSKPFVRHPRQLYTYPKLSFASSGAYANWMDLNLISDIKPSPARAIQIKDPKTGKPINLASDYSSEEETDKLQDDRDAIEETDKLQDDRDAIEELICKTTDINLEDRPSKTVYTKDELYALESTEETPPEGFISDHVKELVETETGSKSSGSRTHPKPSHPPGMGTRTSFGTKFPRDEGPRRSRHARHGGDSVITRAEMITLPVSDDRWVRPVESAMSKVEIVCKEIKTNLNKITPKNFDSVTEAVVSILKNNLQCLNEALSRACKEKSQGVSSAATSEELEEVEIMHETILIFFDKAVDEPNFCPLYAKMCAIISSAKDLPMVGFDDSGKFSSYFKAVLLQRCQTAYEKKVAWTKEKMELEGQQPMGEEAEAERMKIKRKTLGNVVFVGHLFRVGLLRETIIHKCISELLVDIGSNQDSEEEIECFCKLMTITGPLIDRRETQGQINKYFQTAESFVRRNLASRIRFMLMDLVDLRKGHWNRDLACKIGRESMGEPKRSRSRHREDVVQKTTNKKATVVAPTHSNPFQALNNEYVEKRAGSKIDVVEETGNIHKTTLKDKHVPKDQVLELMRQISEAKTEEAICELFGLGVDRINQDLELSIQLLDLVLETGKTTLTGFLAAVEKFLVQYEEWKQDVPKIDFVLGRMVASCMIQLAQRFGWNSTLETLLSSRRVPSVPRLVESLDNTREAKGLAAEIVKRLAELVDRETRQCVGDYAAKFGVLVSTNE